MTAPPIALTDSWLGIIETADRNKLRPEEDLTWSLSTGSSASTPTYFLTDHPTRES